MADHFQHCRLTLNSSHLGFRLPFMPISFRITYQSLYVLGHNLHGKPTSTRPRHRWNRPLEKTLNCLNLGLRLTFLGICAGWWAQGTLLLLL